MGHSQYLEAVWKHVTGGQNVVKGMGDQVALQTCEVLGEWPPHSPDLSPIENVWGIVQREVDALGCKNFKEFELEVVDKLQNFPLRPCTTCTRVWVIG